MPSEAFDRWRAAQMAVALAEQNLLLASDPASAAYAVGTAEDIRSTLPGLKADASRAWGECMAIAARGRRVARGIGLDSQ